MPPENSQRESVDLDTTCSMSSKRIIDAHIEVTNTPSISKRADAYPRKWFVTLHSNLWSTDCYDEIFSSNDVSALREAKFRGSLVPRYREIYGGRRWGYSAYGVGKSTQARPKCSPKKKFRNDRRMTRRNNISGKRYGISDVWIM